MSPDKVCAGLWRWCVVLFASDCLCAGDVGLILV